MVEVAHSSQPRDERGAVRRRLAAAVAALPSLASLPTRGAGGPGRRSRSGGPSPRGSVVVVRDHPDRVDADKAKVPGPSPSGPSGAPNPPTEDSLAALLAGLDGGDRSRLRRLQRKIRSALAAATGGDGQSASTLPWRGAGTGGAAGAAGAEGGAGGARARARRLVARLRERAAGAGGRAHEATFDDDKASPDRLSSPEPPVDPVSRSPERDSARGSDADPAAPPPAAGPRRGSSDLLELAGILTFEPGAFEGEGVDDAADGDGPDGDDATEDDDDGGEDLDVLTALLVPRPAPVAAAPSSSGQEGGVWVGAAGLGGRSSPPGSPVSSALPASGVWPSTGDGPRSQAPLRDRGDSEPRLGPAADAGGGPGAARRRRGTDAPAATRAVAERSRPGSVAGEETPASAHLSPPRSGRAPDSYRHASPVPVPRSRRSGAGDRSRGPDSRRVSAGGLSAGGASLFSLPPEPRDRSLVWMPPGRVVGPLPAMPGAGGGGRPARTAPFDTFDGAGGGEADAAGSEGAGPPGHYAEFWGWHGPGLPRPGLDFRPPGVPASPGGLCPPGRVFPAMPWWHHALCDPYERVNVWSHLLPGLFFVGLPVYVAVLPAAWGGLGHALGASAAMPWPLVAFCWVVGPAQLASALCHTYPDDFRLEKIDHVGIAAWVAAVPPTLLLAKCPGRWAAEAPWLAGFAVCLGGLVGVGDTRLRAGLTIGVGLAMAARFLPSIVGWTLVAELLLYLVGGLFFVRGTNVPPAAVVGADGVARSPGLAASRGLWLADHHLLHLSTSAAALLHVVATWEETGHWAVPDEPLEVRWGDAVWRAPTLPHLPMPQGC